MASVPGDSRTSELYNIFNPSDAFSALKTLYHPHDSAVESLAMTTHYDVGLTINMPDGGRHARKLLNLYHTDLPVDINQVAYDLCGANEAVRARKFDRVTLKRAEVWSDQPGILTLFALLSVFSDDPDFIKKAIAKYMEGFPGYLKEASDQYYTEDSFPPEISLQHTGWSVEVNRNPHG